MSEWIRVTKANPCPVCGHDSWCLISLDGETGLCMRQANDHPKQFRSGEVAYIHRLSGSTVTVVKRREAPERPQIDSKALMDDWAKTTTPEHLSRLSQDLGVKASSLMELGVVWSNKHLAFAFPMCDGFARVIGIRLRCWNGNKWSVRGSHNGIFYPRTTEQDTLWIVEGATDTCAGLSLGLYTVGRPSCSGGLMELKDLVTRKYQIKRVIIIADNDTPGLDGAERLVEHLFVPCCVIVLPCKDLREFIAIGGTAENLEDITKSFVWRNMDYREISR